MNDSLNILLSPAQYTVDNVHFFSMVKNNMTDGNFMKLFYSTSFFSMNGIYINIAPALFNISAFDNCSAYIKFIPDFSATLKQIEHDILKKVDGSIVGGGSPLGRFQEQPRVFLNKKTAMSSLMLKISGVWQSGEQYGLMYKFIPVYANDEVTTV